MNKIEQDITSFDFYSLIHFGVGYWAKKRGFPTQQIMIAAVIYELIEDPLIDGLKLKRWRKETKNNALVDILLAYLGARMAERYGKISTGR